MDTKIIENLLGEYSWLIITGFVFLIARTTLESAISGLKVQNDTLKDYVIEKPLPMLDLKKWDNCND